MSINPGKRTHAYRMVKKLFFISWGIQGEVEKSFGRLLPGFECVSNKEMLDEFGFFSLERWRLSGDVIKVYHGLRGMDRIVSLFPRRERSNTSGHMFMVRGEMLRKNCSAHNYWSKRFGSSDDKYNVLKPVSF